MSGEGAKPGAGRERALARRRYATVRVSGDRMLGHQGAQEHGGASRRGAPLPRAGGFLLLLDAHELRTPGKQTFAVPSRPLADAIAREWVAQGGRIDPESMPLTTLANSAIDGVSGREGAVRSDIVKYAACDLLCYRADRPEALVRRQSQAWDEVLAWAGEALGVRFLVGTGLMPLSQPPAAIDAMAHALADFDPFGLAAMHVITTLTGSALLALALARGRLTAAQAWAAAHVDEAFQISQWGEDAEARARQQRQWRAMQAASQLLELLA